MSESNFGAATKSRQERSRWNAPPLTAKTGVTAYRPQLHRLLGATNDQEVGGGHFFAAFGSSYDVNETDRRRFGKPALPDGAESGEERPVWHLPLAFSSPDGETVEMIGAAQGLPKGSPRAGSHDEELSFPET
jgi:hypothetical protein